MLRRFFDAILCLTLLSGCAEPTAGDAAFVPPSAPPGKALVYFYRPVTAFGVLNTYAVSVDGVEVARLDAGTRFYHPVNPGSVLVAAHEPLDIFNFGLAYLLKSRPNITLQAQAGEVHYLRVSSDMLTGGPAMEVAAAGTVIAEAQGLRPGHANAPTPAVEQAEQHVVLALEDWGTRTLSVPTAAQPRDLVMAGLTDARPDKEIIGRRTAAFGVSMGSVVFAGPVPDFVEAFVSAELRAAGHDVRDTGDGARLSIRLDRFWFDTDTSALYWDINGQVAMTLTVTGDGGSRSEDFACRATERTYDWPSAEIFSNVAEKCLADLSAAIHQSALWQVALARATLRRSAEDARVPRG